MNRGKDDMIVLKDAYYALGARRHTRRVGFMLRLKK